MTMSADERKEARSYAWGYFALHADQRMKLFNFFLILSGLILGAFPAVRGAAPQTKLVGLLPLLLILSAFTFWRLDERTRHLVKNAEAALRFLDGQWPVEPLADGSPHYLRLLERDDYLTGLTSREWWAKRVVPISYTDNFRIAYLMIGGVGAVLTAWVWFGSSDYQNAVPALASRELTKMAALSCNPLFDGWRLTISWPRFILLYCVGVALGLRVVHSLLRARAVQKGDFPHTDDRKDAIIADFRKAFRYCFGGDNEFREHSDLWIPFAIGVVELAVYPVLLVLGQMVIIGGWIGIKTAGAWMGWQASRTSFNRFLLFNMLNLLVSYFWLSHYIERLPCSPG